MRLTCDNAPQGGHHCRKKWCRAGYSRHRGLNLSDLLLPDHDRYKEPGREPRGISDIALHNGVSLIPAMPGAYSVFCAGGVLIDRWVWQG